MTILRLRISKSFEGYSSELRKFILANYPDREVTQTALEIPVELYQVTAGDVGLMAGGRRLHPRLQLFIRERRRIQQSIETVHLIRGKYSTLEFLIKSKYWDYSYLCQVSNPVRDEISVEEN